MEDRDGAICWTAMWDPPLRQHVVFPSDFGSKSEFRGCWLHELPLACRFSLVEVVSIIYGLQGPSQGRLPIRAGLLQL